MDKLRPGGELQSLTHELMEKMFQDILAQQSSPRCGSQDRPHLVHPKEAERGGLMTCVHCGPFYLTIPKETK